MLFFAFSRQASIFHPRKQLESISESATTIRTTNAMATQISGQTSINHTYYSPPMPPTDETAIFYSGLDFTPLNSAAITRVASMSPEMSSKAELDLNKDGSGHHGRPSKPNNRDGAFARRHRAISAPVDGVDLGLLNKKLETDLRTDAGAPEPSVDVEVMQKPTAQEWVADIDCVSDIFGAMVADGDRGGIHF
jgi:hypothetical protein